MSMIIAANEENYVDVEITQDHIENGKRQEASSCPVALCLKELCKENVIVLVDDETIIFSSREASGHTTQQEVKIPDDVSEFVNGFDRGSPSVKSFKTKINIPRNYLR